MTDTEPQMKGTPITRGGGHLIRVGWRAVGYSVDDATESSYRLYSILLFVLAVAVGVAVVYAAEFVFFTYAVPLASKVTPIFRDYPEAFRLLIYMSTLGFGGLIFWHLRVKMGESLVRGATKLHDGYSLLEQRRRASLKRKRERIPLIVGILLVVFVPHDMSSSLQAFLILILLYLLVEGIVFQIWLPKR